MAIKLRKPGPNEERLSWCKGVDVEVCVDNGRLKGKLDFQYLVLPPEELADELSIDRETPVKTYEFVKSVLRGVRGFKDDENEWSDDEQLEFALLAPEIVTVAFHTYFKHIGSGDARKKASGR